MSNGIATGRRILIVEDRSDWQDILARAFRTMKLYNFEVDIAGSYEEALALLRTHAYDLATIDPVLDNTNKYNRDGLRVLEQISEKSPHTPIIVISGSVNYAILHNTENRPPNLHLIEKSHWSRKAFRSLVEKVIESSYDPAEITHINLLVSTDNQGLQPYRPALHEIPSPPGYRSGVPRVLVIEDRPDWQAILARALEDEGWYWRMASSATEAVPIIEAQEPMFQVVLLDLRIGDRDIPLREGQGWQLLDYLAAAAPRSKVIIVSGEASRGDVATLFTGYPVAGFIDKDSFQRQSLIDVVREVTAGPHLRIQTLGDFRIWRDGVVIDDLGNHEAEMLIKLLLTHRGQSLSSDTIYDLLQYDPKDFNLRDSINAARYILQNNLVHPSDSCFLLEDEKGHFSFAISGDVILDFEVLEAIRRNGILYERASYFDRAIATYEQSIEIYKGVYLLENLFAKWSMPLRSDLQRQYTESLNRLADLYARAGRLKDALAIARLSLQEDSYKESNYRRVMRLYACLGLYDEAHKIYHALKKLFNEFFQDEPDTTTQELYRAIIKQEDISPIEGVE